MPSPPNQTFDGSVLALDLASQTGWAYGPPWQTPQSGSVRFAKRGSSLGAYFAGCRSWLQMFHMKHPFKVLVFEAPVSPSFMTGKTNANTIRLLIGLTAIVEEFSYSVGMDVREARVSDVRVHFLGSNRFRRAIAKSATVQKCRLMGWNPIDDNAADALALWSYQVAILVPETAMRSTPLWGTK